MARAQILSNDSLLVTFDERGLVRDLYFPYVGLENHVGRGLIHRVGVYVDGEMSWFTSPEWQIDLSTASESFIGLVKAEHKRLGVTVTFTDAVYNEKNIFVRHAVVENRTPHPRDIRLFFAQEFTLQASMRADTAYFDPRVRALVHYKGRRVMLANAFGPEGQFDDYTVGEFGYKGKEGSFRDAEDGKLSKNAIEHGTADSVLSIPLHVSGNGSVDAYYWLAAAELIDEAHHLNQYVLEKNPTHLIASTRDYWKAWVNRSHYSFHGLSEKIEDLFKRSLFYVRAAADEHGSIIASADSSILQGGKDTYLYSWPRDSAVCAIALDRTGDMYAARRYFEFTRDVISRGGFLMQKFQPDRSLGSSWHPWMRDGKPALPIQEDETALTLIALLSHYQETKDLEFIESMYNSFIKPAADFLVKHRDEETGLPAPSYDLWEEKYGIHTYTAATIAGGLRAAAEFSRILGKEYARTRYEGARKEIMRALLSTLYDEKRGYFYKGAYRDAGGSLLFDTTIDASSVYGLVAFGVLSPHDEKVTRALEATLDALTLTTHSRGLARYEGDAYYRADNTTVGNPWMITTIWMAQLAIARAEHEDDLKEAVKILEWCTYHALPTGVLPEQIHPHTGGPLSATPLTWSHAEFVLTVLAYLDKLEEFGVAEAILPLKDAHNPLTRTPPPAT